MTSKHRGPQLSTTALGTFVSDQNEAPESSLVSNDDAPDSLAMLDPQPGGLVLSYYTWMLDISGVDQDINLIKEPNLANSLTAENISFEVSVDENIEGEHKYDIQDIANVIQNIISE